MTHQGMTRIQRQDVADPDSPLSVATPQDNFPDAGASVALTVALRYLATRRTLSRAQGAAFRNRD